MVCIEKCNGAALRLRDDCQSRQVNVVSGSLIRLTTTTVTGVLTVVVAVVGANTGDWLQKVVVNVVGRETGLTQPRASVTISV